MKKSILSAALALIVFNVTFAQTEEDPYVSGPSVLSPSPNAASLGRYAEFPVSLYTGIPAINIPLYDISAKGLGLSVNLSYHAKGIRVEEAASWVGLGWSLNAGGVITRSVVGLPDDQVGGEQTPSTCGGWINSHDGFLSTGQTIENLYNATIGSAHESTLLDLAEGAKDGEPDKFFFNFGGVSGEFVLDKNGVPALASDQKLAITYTRNAQQRIISFKVVDQNGTSYYFNEAELTHTYSNVETTGNYPFPDVFLFSSTQYCGACEYYSSWYLTKIENANKTDQIDLTYVNENLNDVREFSYEKKNWLSIPGNNVQQSFNSREYFINGKRLSTITWSGGSLTFQASHTRQDIGTLAVSGGATTNYALTKISLKDPDNNVLKSFLFDYAYFVSTDFTPSGGGDACLGKRLKLVSLTEESSVLGTTKPPHQFFYDETYSLPYKVSPYTDYWGFPNVLPGSNGAGGGDPTKQYFYPNDPPDNVTLSRYSIYPRTSHSGEVLLNGYDKTPNFTYMKLGVLNKIVFPTKGYTELEYEANSFHFMSQNRTGGGLRIKKTTTYDGMDHLKDIIKTYTYTLSADPAKSSGLVMYLPFFAKYEGYYSSQHRHDMYNNSISGLGTTQGGYVGYQEVTVTHNGNGKVWSKFHVPAAFGVANEDWTGSAYIYNRTNAVGTYYLAGGCGLHAAEKSNDNYPYAQNPNYDWNRGSLLEEKTYNNSDQLVRRVLGEYTIKDHRKVYAVKNVKLAWACSEGSSNPVCYLHKYAKYYLLSGWLVKSKETVENYDPATAALLIKTDTWFNYDNAAHMLLTSTKTYDSRGKEMKTEYKRPQDYTASTNFTNDLITQHNYTPVLEQLSWANNGSGYKLVGGKFTTYGNYATANGLSNPQWLVNKTYNIETASPITQATFTTTVINNSTITLDSRYKQLGEYNYDAKDNLTRYSYLNTGNKNNTTYIWGYNKTTAIAKVSNATEAECGFTGFESDDQNLWNMSTSISDADAHTGISSRKIPAGATVYGTTRDYLPSATYRNEKFIMSCWVKTTAAYANNAGNLVLYTMQNNGSTAVYPSVASAYVATTISNTNGEWKYVEVEIDLNKIKTDGGLPLTTDLKIRSFLLNTDPSNYILIDDIRFYPKEARMSSYTFSPLKGMTTASNENSDAVYYEYDVFGRYKLVKDQFGRILEKVDYNYKP